MKGNAFLSIHDLASETRRIEALQNITKYRDDLVSAAVLHIKMLDEELKYTIEEPTIEGTEQQKQVTAISLIKYTTMQQLKRVVLIYLRTRMNIIMHCLWDFGGAGAASASKLTANFGEVLSPNETAFVRSYISKVCDFKGEYMELDIGSILRPPLEIYVEVRVLQDCGEIVTCTGPVRLTKNSQHYLKRSDVESLINAGYLKHVV